MAMVGDWRTDFVKAKEKARQEHKFILLNFSGSDWCIPCIKTKKEIFDKEDFSRFADSSLVLVNADFPRLNKDKLPKSQENENERLAEQYNKDGAFPLTLLLDPNGKVVKEWKGYPNLSPKAFVQQIKSIEPRR